MFGFLKDKIKSTISSITEKFQKEAEEEKIEETIEIKEEKKKEKPKKEEKKPKEKKVKEKPKKIEEEIIEEELPEEPAYEEPEVIEEKPKEEPVKEKKGFFKKLTETITTSKISEDKFEDLFSELEMALLENNVAFEVVEKIKLDLKKDIVDVPIKRSDISTKIQEALKSSLEDIFKQEKINLIHEIKNKKEKPYVIVFVGVNGSGKTTTIAKVANLLKKNKLTCVLAASDTFRAAAIQQLEEHANRLGIKIIKHDYGSDPSAVAFDAIKHAKAHNIDCVLIDTAGRQHSNKNLIAEMEKITRVTKPDLKIFIGESITGNDAVEQSKSFNDSINIDGIILTKSDIDEKGGAMISVGYITGKPIIYLGSGQNYDDLKEFNSKEIIKNLGL